MRLSCHQVAPRYRLHGQSLHGRDGKSLPALDQSFRDFMDGTLPALPGEFATMQDWELHLGFMYPEV